MSSPTEQASWVYRIPRHLAFCLLGMQLVLSQLFPFDSVVNVANGESLALILLSLSIGTLVAIDGLLTPREREWPLQNGWIAVGCVLFGVWIWIAAQHQIGIGNARNALNGCWQWIGELVLLLSIGKLATCQRNRGCILNLMTACAVGTVFHALYQYFYGLPNARAVYAANPEYVLSQLGIAAGSTEALLYSTRLETADAMGPFALTNSMAAFLSVWLVFNATFLWARISTGNQQSPSSKSERLSRIFGCVLCLALLSGLLITKGRAAWLATIIGMGLAYVAHPDLRKSGLSLMKRNLKVAMLLVAIVVVPVVVLVVKDPELIGHAGKSLAYRFDYWRGALALIQESPIFGFGPNTFQTNYTRVKVITASESPADPHNFLLEVAFAGGIPLFIFLGLIACLIIWACWQCHSDKIDMDEPDEVAGSNAMIVGSAISILGTIGFHMLASSSDSWNSLILFSVVFVVTFAFLSKADWYRNTVGLKWVAMATVLVLLMNLIASGGWMLPGVMNSCCVLLGISMSLGNNRCQRIGYPYVMWVRVIAIVLMMVSSVEFLRSMYIPLNKTAEKISILEQENISSWTSMQWLELLEIDRVDPELPRQVANNVAQVLTQRGQTMSTTEQDRWVAAFQEANAEYVRRDCKNWMPLLDSGNWCVLLAEKFADMQNAARTKSFAELAAKHYAAAATLYPNSVPVQMQAAVGAAWIKKYDSAKLYMAKVTEIDASTKHKDRKITRATVFFPRTLETPESHLPENARLTKQPLTARGEPVMQWLRTNVP